MAVEGSGARAQGIVDETVAWLIAHRVQDEVLAELGEKRGLLGMGRRPVLTPIGRVWRLGVLLVDRDGGAYATGAITRATPPRHSNYQSVSGEERRDIRRLAYESSAFRAGESINYNARRLDLSDQSVASGDGPVSFVDGVVSVEWAPGQKKVPLERYLHERRALLTVHDGWTAPEQ